MSKRRKQPAAAKNKSSAAPANFPPPPPAGTRGFRAAVFDPPFRWAVVVLFLATIATYLSSPPRGLVWDDDAHVTKAELRSWSGLARIWTEPAATQQYYPLLHSAFWLEHRLWGDHPLGYRLLNVLLHATSACLFAALLRKLKIPGAWLAAFIFALHPVSVESVAWITEQKNTLSLVFYLSAALLYWRFHETRRGWWYVLATGLFVAALLCKTVTATLPAALLVLLWWQRGRLDGRREVLPLSLWLALGLGAGLVTSWVEWHLIGAQGVEYDLSALQRVLLAGRIVWFYVGKLVWPVELIFIYPRWVVNAGAIWQFVFPLGVGGVLVALVGWSRKSRGPLAAALIFVGSLVPALGFVNVYPFKFSFVADHFQYQASLALIAAFAAALTRGLNRLPRWRGKIIVLGLLTTLSALAARQVREYRDNFTLFTATIRKNPGAWMAHGNLAMMASDAGRPGDALPYLEEVAKLHPDSPEMENCFGDVLTRAGRAPEAVLHLQRALALRPNFPEAHNNLGIAFMATRRLPEALAEFREASRLDPNYAAARFNLGLALAHTGNTAEAIEHFQEALRLKPDYADPELHWGVCLTLERKYAEAAPHFQRAIELNPRSAEAIRLYGVFLGQADRLPEAIAQLRRALEIQPDFAQAHLDLAQLLKLNGQVDEAAAHQREALRLRAAAPGHP